MKRILIIDDELQVRTMLKKFFEKKNYEVVEAANGKEGYKVYRKNPRGIIITDIFMPEQEGLETIQKLKQEYPRAKIIALSGGVRSYHQGALIAAKSFGASRVFSKPVDLTVLSAAVEEMAQQP